MVTTMDTEATDSSTGVSDSLNGETKPDPARLAQTAIIKQVESPFAFLMLANINYPGHMSLHILCSPMHIFNYAHFGYATLPTTAVLNVMVRVKASRPTVIGGNRKWTQSWVRHTAVDILADEKGFVKELLKL